MLTQPGASWVGDPGWVRACPPARRGRPGPHPGHPTAVGGLPASKPGLHADAHDLREENVADGRHNCPTDVTLARLAAWLTTTCWCWVRAPVDRRRRSRPRSSARRSD